MLWFHFDLMQCASVGLLLAQFVILFVVVGLALFVQLEYDLEECSSMLTDRPGQGELLLGCEDSL